MPHASAFLMTVFRTSMINRNNNGDSGSPYFNPRAWGIRSPGAPLINTLVLAEERIADIH
jgi:hypothetical protein